MKLNLAEFTCDQLLVESEYEQNAHPQFLMTI